MEEWRLAVWVALGLNLVAFVLNITAAIRCERKAGRLDRETYEKRPVISDDKMAVLPEQADDEAARKETAKWLMQAMNEVGERDRVVLAELRDRIEAANKESAAGVLQEARLQLATELEPLLLTIRKKAQDLQCLQPGPAGMQELLEDVRALSEVISKTP